MQQEFTKEINKAEILVEALGYMQKYEGDIVVIKYGGSAMTNEIIKKSVLKDIAVLKSVGLKPIIVHGGGKDINRMLDRVQIKSEFKNGLRVTDCDTLEIAEMVLSGKVNKGLVTHLEQIGTHAVGLSGKDGNMITVEKVMPQGEDIGYVGKITKVDTTLINALLEQGYIPIISNNAGLLDPFVIMKNVKDAESLAIDILTFLTGISSRDGEKFPVLRKAVRSVTQSDSRGLLHVIDELRREDTPISRNIANHIDSFTVPLIGKLGIDGFHLRLFLTDHKQERIGKFLIQIIIKKCIIYR